MFIASGTQWRMAGSGFATGLDYAAVEAVMRMRRVALTRRAGVLDDVRIMEEVAMDILAKRAEQAMKAPASIGLRGRRG